MAHHIAFLLDQLGRIDYERTPDRLALYADFKRQTQLRLQRRRYSRAQIAATVRNIDLAIGEIEENFAGYREYFADDAIFAGYQYGPEPVRPRAARAARDRSRRSSGGAAAVARVLVMGLAGLAAVGAGGAGALYLFDRQGLFERTETAVATNDSFEDIVVFFDHYRQRLEDFRARSKDDVYPIAKTFVAFDDLEGFVARNLNRDFPLAAGMSEIAGQLRYKSPDGKGFKLVAVNTGICSPLLLIRPELADPRRSNEPFDCAAFGIWNDEGAGY